MTVLENIKLEIPQDTGISFLTKLMGGRLNPEIEGLLFEKSEACMDSIEPKAAYINHRIEKVLDDKVYFSAGNIFTGPNISKILEGSETATIFLTTLGSRTDKTIKDVSESGDTLATIVMDAITTELLGILGNHVGEIIKKEGIREKNWGSTCKYSPGQYKWTIEEQKEIFSMLDGSKIGIELNKSYLMVPFKSISGVYGFGPAESIDKTRVACDLCPRENCIGRK